MILIGQFDSPFVRRVAVTASLYGLAFEHRLWSVFGDAAALAALNPLMRVPVLVLDDGTVLTDSFVILDELDRMVPEDRALVARDGAARREVMRVAALGSGLADKAVALFYERRLHEVTSPVWESRCRAQIAQVLDALERDLAGRESSGQAGPWWLGERFSHADLAIGAGLAFASEAHGEVLGIADRPALAALAARVQALPAMVAHYQAFRAPA